MKLHNIEQGSEEWLQIRIGKFTASEFHTLMGNSQTKKTILLKKAAERITGVKSDGDSFSSLHTDRGKELEQSARMAYEFDSGVDVEEIGFVELSETVGCSPDGVIGGEGGVEIKCKDNHTHLYAVMNNYIEPAHRTQCQFNMMVTEAKWWDYVLYNPNFDNPLHIIRIERDEEYISKIQTALNECEYEVQKYITKFKGINHD